MAKSGRSGPPQMHACNYPCGPDCVHNNTCTPIGVFFGTNRERREHVDRIDFGPDRGGDMSLGRAIVTVPRYHGIGKVERPSYWSSMVFWKAGKEDPERHFTIPKDGVEVFASREAFIAAMQAAFGELTDFRDHALVYVHGFSMSFDDALFRAAQMAYDLGADRQSSRIPFAVPFVFSWPARGGLLDYVTDKESAQLAETHLRTFLEMVATQSGAKHIHLVAHSMGNQPLLNVLTRIAEMRPDIRFGHIVLAAPDVDRKQFSEVAQRVRPLAESITLYASANDWAMTISRSIHSGFYRAGDVPPEGPVLVRGVDSIDVSALSTEFFSVSHSKYADDNQLVGVLLRQSIRPPHVRTPVLRRKANGELEFWIYPN